MEIPKEKKKVNSKPTGISVSYFKLPNENKKMSYRRKKENKKRILKGVKNTILSIEKTIYLEFYNIFKLKLKCIFLKARPRDVKNKATRLKFIRNNQKLCFEISFKCLLIKKGFYFRLMDCVAALRIYLMMI